MSLLHALVARDNTILAEHDKKAGQYGNGAPDRGVRVALH